ncbi:MAG: GGDEF domain-containing protein [Clostridiaceae bacterium]|nr:GGDEF domain-containing protein [Clostridiaceae bacterium]
MAGSVQNTVDNQDRQFSLRQAYDQDQLIHNRFFITLIALSAGLMQLVFLVPDMIHLSQGRARLASLVLRLAVCCACLAFAWANHRGRVRTYRQYCLLATALEAAAVLLFLVVFLQYDPPHYIIQAMGMMIIIMLVMIIANRYRYKLVLSGLSLIAFLVLSAVRLGARLDLNEFLAGAFYLTVVLALCAIFSRRLDKHMYFEFQAKHQLIHLSSVDPLTGACNRTRLIEAWNHWSAWNRRYHQPLSLVLLDIDNFKQINDQLGHQEADAVLVALVRLIQGQLRDTDLLARWGGDEFVLLLPNTTPEQAVYAIKRMQRLLAFKPLIGSTTVRCSFGLAAMQAASSLDDLIRLADKRMYAAKKAGGNQIGTDSLPVTSSPV